ncbi:MAG: S8 family serine peptidase [Pseudobdellovibrio sp.]
MQFKGPSKSKILSGAVVFVGLFVLLFEFNNCGKINSQSATQDGSIDSASTAGSNSDVLQCISSSDGVKVSSALRKSVTLSAGASSNKINSLDWDQKEDLLVTLDNQCAVNSDFNDPIISYLDLSTIDVNQRKSFHVIKKESVSNLSLFIQSALESECLLSADKNYRLKVSAINEGPDTYFNSQAHLASTTTSAVAINATKTVMNTILAYVGDAAYTKYDHTVKVGVIDTGVDSTNPDLAPVLARDASNNIIGANTTDDPSQGFASDSGYHGTHVAGLIGAQYNNSIGVSGVYGRNVAIYPLRVSNDGDSMTVAALAAALQKALDLKLDIVNMSLSADTDISGFRTAINEAVAAGLTVVVAAGNGDPNTGIGGVLGSTIYSYPAMYSNANNGVITVGSVDLATQTISFFSNKSPTYVDILAPGSNSSYGILSTIPLNQNIPSGQTSGPGYGSSINYSDGSYDLIQGTSMATPMVTGALAAAVSMVKSRGKVITNLQLKNWLHSNGSPKSSAFTSYSNGGSYLNLQSLYTYATNTISSLPSSSSGGGGSSSGISITMQPISKQLVVGESVSLSVIVSSSSALTYQWYKDDVAIPGATSSQINLSNTQPESAGVYKVVITSNGLSVTSSEATLKVALAYCN